MVVVYLERSPSGHHIHHYGLLVCVLHCKPPPSHESLDPRRRLGVPRIDRSRGAFDREASARMGMDFPDGIKEDGMVPSRPVESGH